MKILALDAALGFFSVALDLDGNVTVERSDRHDALETGLVRVAALLSTARVDLAGLDRIAVGIGPGSFTGIRIALSFAKSLAFGADLPLVGISSYDVLTPSDAPLPCLTVITGRPGVVCARLLTPSGESDTACGPPAEVFDRLLARLAPGTGVTLATDTEDALPDTGERNPTVHALISPAIANPAAALARLARRRSPAPSPHSLAPDYGELPAVSMPKAQTTAL